MHASPRRLAWILASALTLAAGIAAAPAPAVASTGQAMYMEAPTELLSAKLRPAALSTLQSLGVHALRVVMYWDDVAPSPNSASTPKVDLTNPANYAWGQYAALITAAQKLHWPVLLDVSGPVPKWATATHKDHVTRPDPLDFERFMTAVGKEFSSQIRLWAIWNEPNHPFFLMPQFNANGTPASPLIYRALWQAGYAGLQNAGVARPSVLIGDTAPTGYEHTVGAHDVAPITFLQDTLCLNTHYRKASTCSLLPAAGWAHHAYTIPAGPTFQWSDPNDVAIGSLGRLTAALDAAARAGALPPGLPIYLTEFGWQTKPNNSGLAVSTANQAIFDAVSERIAYYNPRVAAFSQYLLRDDPVGGPPGSGVSGGYVGFQTGLEYLSGQPKPLFYGFRLPLVVTRQGGGFSFWGLVRPATGATHVQVLVLYKGSHRSVDLARSVTTNSHGYWTLYAKARGAVSFAVRWRSPSGTLYTGATITPFPH